ncbi:secretin N-terminal domain-containing protein [Hydrogenimonas sp.]
MRRMVAALLCSTLLLFGAPDCQTKLFSFKTGQQSGAVTLYDVLENLADTCEFSVMFADTEARRVLKTPLKMVYIRDYTLEDMFRFLFDDHNMFYRYDPERRVLTVSYIETRSFHIDYVNLTELKTESVKSITVGASGSQNSVYGSSGSYGGTSTASQGSYGRSGSGDNSDYTTIKTVTEFNFWSSFKQQIDAILQRDEDSHTVKSKALINNEAGIVTVTGTKRQIERVEKYIAHVMGRLHKQIMLEARLVELRYNDRNTTGVDWSRFDIALKGQVSDTYERGVASLTKRPFYSFSYDFTMDGLLDFLQHYGTVNTLSNPKIMTLNNQPAVINVGDQINYKYQTGAITTTTTGNPVGTNTYQLGSVFIGLTLNIVPEVTDDGFIILRVNPVVSEMLGNNQVTDMTYQQGDTTTEEVRTMPPDVKIKQLTSIVKVKNGHKVIIGGLISNRTYSTNTKVPLLGDIPVVGRAFSHTGEETQKVELIIILTPRIVDGSSFPTIDDALQMGMK